MAIGDAPFLLAISLDAKPFSIEAEPQPAVTSISASLDICIR